MKKIMIILFLGFLFTSKTNAQYTSFSSAGPSTYSFSIRNAEGKINKFYQTDYLPGSYIISPNQKYLAKMEADGYFVLYEITPNGRVVKWKFPQKTAPIPGSGISFTEGVCQFGPSTHYAVVNVGVTGLGSANLLKFDQNNGGVTMAVTDDGKLFANNVGFPSKGWICNTSEYNGSVVEDPKYQFVLNYFSSYGGAIFTPGHFSRYEFHSYPAGSFVTSVNGKYKLIMQSSGYLELLENTRFGSIKRWQFPDEGKGVPGDQLILAESGSTVANPLSSSAVVAGVGVNIFSPLFKKITKEITCIGGINMNLSNDGNISLLIAGASILKPFIAIWTSNTSEKEPNSNVQLPAYTRNGHDLTVNSVFNDEALTTHFTMGNIYFPGSLVFQDVNPVKFVADGYIELQPGFITEMKGNGAFIIEGMRHVTTSSPPSTAMSATRNNKVGNANLGKPEEQAVNKPAKVNLVPNPTSGIVNIQLASKDDKVQYIKLFDSNGGVVAEYKSTTTINIEKLAAGIYYYQVRTEKEGMHTGKIRKQ